MDVWVWRESMRYRLTVALPSISGIAPKPIGTPLAVCSSRVALTVFTNGPIHTAAVATALAF